MKAVFIYNTYKRYAYFESGILRDVSYLRDFLKFLIQFILWKKEK